ncbi:MAG TPA: universal stress protein [Dehalococcoidia bacterium]|jgi:nucleotide-binding universal stress UspA family protein
MPKIVVPLDGSHLAETALCRLWQLKGLGRQEVVLVGVITDTDEAVQGLDAYTEKAQVLMAAYLHDTAKKLELQADVTTQLRFGKADVEVRKVADSIGADFVLLTTHGRSGFERWSVGSVADKIIRGADRPTLVIGPRAMKQEPLREIKRILVPLDGSEVGEKAVSVGAQWAKALDASLHIVRVVSLAPLMASDPLTGYYPAEMITAVEDAASEYLKEIAGRPGLGTVKASIMHGDAATELTSYVEGNAIDLVIMTSRGRGGAARTVLGSTADRMLHGPAPVLILPSTSSA